MLGTIEIAVAALFEATIRIAAVAGGVIAVVTLLPGVDIAIPATRWLNQASLRTTIPVGEVPIVAFLVAVDDPVAALFEIAVPIAAVAGLIVAIIATLTGVEVAVATSRRLDTTVRCTTILRQIVAVVAGLPAVQDAIPANLKRAKIGATVARRIVAIIATLTGVEIAIATTRWLNQAKGRTTIAVDEVAVIALFETIDSSVAAGLARALAAAAVARAVVSVIALLT